MNKFHLASLLLLLFISFSLCQKSFGQITITENDMPSSGENFITTNCVLDFTIDVNETGANHSWDYSGVVPVTTFGDTFLNVTSLPLTYFLVFLLTSNLADRSGLNFSIGGYGLEDVYTMYKKSSSQYQITGYGGTLSGVEIPLPYGASKDVLYTFPLNYGNADSSDATVSYSFPGLFYYSQQRHRVNEVDGWGTIKTPVGTFDAVRVKSTITDVDSFYVDTLSFGTGLTLKSYEYKWLAQNKGTPVFQIGAQDLLGYPVISQVQYQDTTFHTGINDLAENTMVKIFPNPAGDLIQFEFSSQHINSVFIYDVLGRIEETRTFSSPVSNFILNVSQLQNGMYFARMMQNDKSFTSTFIVNH